MDKLYDWVDADQLPPKPGFSARRTSRLFVAVLLSYMIGAIPSAALTIGIVVIKHQREEQIKQAKLRQAWGEAEKAVREGTAGEATRRLFGITEPPQPKLGPAAGVIVNR